jgi:hypothetical protein
MEKRISLWSYWLGMLCLLLTILLRGLAALEFYPRLVPGYGAPISYNTFMHGTILFLLLSIAAGMVGRSRS